MQRIVNTLRSLSGPTIFKGIFRIGSANGIVVSQVKFEDGLVYSGLDIETIRAYRLQRCVARATGRRLDADSIGMEDGDRFPSSPNQIRKMHSGTISVPLKRVREHLFAVKPVQSVWAT